MTCFELFEEEKIVNQLNSNFSLNSRQNGYLSTRQRRDSLGRRDDRVTYIHIIYILPDNLICQEYCWVDIINPPGGLATVSVVSEVD